MSCSPGSFPGRQAGLGFLLPCSHSKPCTPILYPPLLTCPSPHSLDCKLLEGREQAFPNQVLGLAGPTCSPNAARAQEHVMGCRGVSGSTTPLLSPISSFQLLKRPSRPRTRRPHRVQAEASRGRPLPGTPSWLLPAQWLPGHQTSTFDMLVLSQAEPQAEK